MPKPRKTFGLDQLGPVRVRRPTPAIDKYGYSVADRYFRPHAKKRKPLSPERQAILDAFRAKHGIIAPDPDAPPNKTLWLLKNAGKGIRGRAGPRPVTLPQINIPDPEGFD